MTVQVRSTTRRARKSAVDNLGKGVVKLGNGKLLLKVGNGRNLQGSLIYKRYGPFENTPAGRADLATARDKHVLALAERKVESLPLGRAEKTITLRTWAKHWLEVQVPNDTASTTAAKYASTMAKHVLPYLGDYPLDLLTKEVVETWRKDLVARGVGAPTINGTLKRLKTCLTAAVDAKRVGENVATRVRPVDKGADPERESNFSDYPRLIAAAADHYLAALIPVGAATGLRESELGGLHWRDVELDYIDSRTGAPAPRLVLRWHLAASGTGAARQLAMRPGTKASKGEFETVALSQQAVAALRAHRARMADHKLASRAWSKAAGRPTEWFYGKAKNDACTATHRRYVVPSNPVADDALVFPRADGAPLPTNGLYDWFVRVAAKAGVAKTPHGMRHDCGSFMLARNVPLAVVSRHLRHSSPAFTARVYLHQIREQERMGVDALDSLWASLAPAEAV